MSHYHFIKSLVLMLLFSLMLAACQSSDEFLTTPVSTIPPVITSDPPTISTTSTLGATPMLPTVVTPDLMTTSSPFTPTATTVLASAITATPAMTATPTMDVRSLGLLVFDQQGDSIGRLSFDGLQFQPLNQVPKLDPTSLEYGLFTGQSGYFISPDGKWLSTIVGYDQLSLVNTLTDQRSNIARIGAGAWLGWSHDSQSLAYREGESKVCVYKLVEQTVNCLNEFEGKVVAAAWSPDGGKLALSAAGELEEDAPGLVNGAVWVIDMATQQTQLVTNQGLPLGSVSASDLVVWTDQGLIVNRLLNGGVAALFDEDIETLLAANAVSASPTGNYVIYEDGRVDRVSSSNLLAQLPVCAETQTQTMRIVWAHDENSFAYTIHCATAETTQLGIVRLDNHDSTWNRTISNNLRLIGWSYDGDYLLFRHEPGEPQIGYTIERLGITPDSMVETLADSTFLIGILGSGAGNKPQP